MSTSVFRGGPVFTADPAGSSATAVAVRDGRIVAVGGAAEVAPFLARADEVVDLRGRMLLPGFVDAHVHPVMAGIERNRCDLSGIDDLEGYRAAIAEYAAQHRDAGWVLGGGWSMAAFPRGLPERSQLDDVTAGRPAYFPNRDHHSGWASSAALERAGIDRTTADPADGRIERDAEGHPTGALHEGAMRLVEAVLPATTQDDYDAGLRAGLAHLNSVGVTGWQDAWVETDLSVPGVHAAYLHAEEGGWLTARVSGALWWERDTPSDAVEAEVRRLCDIRDATNARGSDRYGVHSVKIMQDGVAETFTAAMLEPYLDSCGCPTRNAGISFLAPDLLQHVIRTLDAARFQVHVHALGDRAVRDVLDALEAARSANGTADLRHHLAHLQVIAPADVPRFRELGVSANLQALWATHEPEMDELTIPFLGAARARRQYPFGDLFRAGTTLAMGSDWPVSEPDPMRAIHVAVNRFEPGHPAGTPPLVDGQQLPLTAALRAYTAGSAWVNRREEMTGTIRVGAAGDLVVLSTDPFALAEHEIGGVTVDRTYVDGECVHAVDGA